MSVSSCRFCQSSSSAVESSGSAPGSPSTSSTSVSASSGSTRSPTRLAGSSIARRSSEACIGPTSTWLAPSSSASAREGGETAVEVCSHRDRHDGAALRVGRRAGERVDERGALRLVRLAGGEQLLELVDGEQDAARRRSARRAPRQRDPSRPRRACAVARRAAARPGGSALAASARCPAARRRPVPASRPARSTDDLPLPDGPTMPRKRGADEAGDELGDQPLAAEEVVGVGGLEAGQALERADALRPPAARRRRGARAHVLVRARAAGRSPCRPAPPRPRSGRCGRRRHGRRPRRAARLASSTVDRQRRPGELAAAGVALARAPSRAPCAITSSSAAGSSGRCSLSSRRLRVAGGRRPLPRRMSRRNGGSPGQALVEHAAERVDVGASVELLAGDLLGSDVVDRAHQLAVVAEPGLLGEPLVSPKSAR